MLARGARISEVVWARQAGPTPWADPSSGLLISFQTLGLAQRRALVPALPLEVELAAVRESVRMRLLCWVSPHAG